MRGSSSPIRVMIVDDHAMVRRGLTTFLKSFSDLRLAGEADSGEAAVSLCEEFHPEVILMDMMLPKMSGTDAIRLIRRKHPQMHILALTSFREGGLIREALEAGAIGYILKDVSADELAAAIRAARGPRHPVPGSDAIPGGDRLPAGAPNVRSERARARGASPDGRGSEQYPDRKPAGRQPIDCKVTR